MKTKKSKPYVALSTLMALLLITILSFKNPTCAEKVIFEEGYKCPNCNIILIIIDTLRADHLGCYGYKKDTSPNIDEFVKESIFFENAYSTSAWTFPSHFSIFTSRYPDKNEFLMFRDIKAFDDSYTTLTEILKLEDYETVAFTGGNYVAEELGFGQGFNKYITRGYRFEHNQKELIGWIAEHDINKKFFLFIHGYNCHQPYNSPNHLKNKFIKEIPDECKGVIFKNKEPQKIKCLETENGIDYAKSQYDAEIFYVDIIIKNIFDELKRNNLYNNSIIIITSDHGEELKDHGGMGHIKTLYQESIKIPLIIRLPKKEGKTIKSKVTNLDLMPTLLDILDIPYIETNIHGRSMAPLLNMKEQDSDIYTLTGVTGKMARKMEGGPFILLSTMHKNFKLIIKIIRNKSNIYELYELDKDPLEKNNLFDKPDYKSIISTLEKNIKDWANRVGLNLDLYQIEGSRNELDQETLEQLRSLGYIN